MPRLIFEKKLDAVWISHLDLMRVFQRAFKRAGLSLKHTQGYNPRPSVSIALPLSVGTESSCELLDFELENTDVSFEEITHRLNVALIDGIKVLQVYDSGRKIKELSLLKCSITLGYNTCVPEYAKDKISALLTSDQLIVQKKSKSSGIIDQDIIPMIHDVEWKQAGDKLLCIDVLINCQNPTLNPSQIVQAIESYLPECKPDHVFFSRNEIFDKDHVIFR